MFWSHVLFSCPSKTQNSVSTLIRKETCIVICWKWHSEWPSRNVNWCYLLLEAQLLSLLCLWDAGRPGYLQEASPHTSLCSSSSSQLLRMKVDSIQTAWQQVDLMRCEGCSCQGMPGVPGRESQILTPHLRCQKQASWPCVRPGRPGVVVSAWIPSTQEKEAGRLQVWHHPELYSEFMASLGNTGKPRHTQAFKQTRQKITATTKPVI